MNPQLLQQQVAQTLSDPRTQPDNRGVPQQQYNPLSDPAVLQALAQVQAQQAAQAQAQQQQWMQMMQQANAGGGPQQVQPSQAAFAPKY